MKIIRVQTLAAIMVFFLPISAFSQDIIRAQVSAPGSTMYVVGTHLASVLKQRHGYTVEVATGFPGVRSMVNNANYDAELTIYAPALAHFLNKGIAMFKDLENHSELANRLRVLFTYNGDMFTFGTYDQNIKSMSDLEGKRVFLGPKGAALVRINSDLIEAATGLVAGEDYELVHVDWAGSPALLQDGSVDVLFQLCAEGCSNWTELSASRKLYFVGYTDEMIEEEQFQEHLKFPGRQITQISPNAWGENQGNSEPVNVIGEFTGLVTNDKLSDEIAYNIAKAFWETKDSLAKVAPFASDFNIEDATFGAVNSLHPGSAKYLSEQGVPVQ